MLHDKTQDVPPEIMAEIFLLVSDTRVFIPPPENGYPWILGCVCSRWRQILWNSPQIWNHIEVAYLQEKIPTFRDLDPDNVIAGGYDAGVILNHVLSRIAGPISLSTSGLFGHASGAVLGNLDRFTELSIFDISQDMLFSMFQLPSTAFPLLETLTLTSSLNGQAPEHTTSPFETLPNLRDVTLTIESPTFVPSLLLLPWATLEYVNISCMRTPPTVVWEILRSSPCLISCYFVVDSAPAIPIIPEFIVPALMDLELNTANDFDWDGFFRPLVIPSLQCVFLTAHGIPCTMLASLITRSQCALTHLQFYESNRHPQEAGQSDIEVLLDHLPSLTRLWMMQAIPRHVFKRMQDGALPALVTADLNVHPDGFGGFLDMLDALVVSPNRRSRCFGVVCFRGPQFAEERARYLSRYELYHSVDGLEVFLLDGDDLTEMEPPQNDDGAE